MNEDQEVILECLMESVEGNTFPIERLHQLHERYPFVEHESYEKLSKKQEFELLKEFAERGLDLLENQKGD